MEIEYNRGENGNDWRDIFEHNCFENGQEKIGIEFIVVKQEWRQLKTGLWVRYIKKSNLTSVTIEKISDEEIKQTRNPAYKSLAP